ncbi:MAG: hypothetical protein J7641_16675 [Cyanobacteria bacterium SID2]|nr:hypothetical protein [Cyanobacteria bacterium SID2]MBP0004896.1 hypothetical protein [Cyanobacteria bacterium SBC]
MKSRSLAWTMKHEACCVKQQELKSYQSARPSFLSDTWDSSLLAPLPISSPPHLLTATPPGEPRAF